MTDVQRWSPEGYDRNARFVSDLGAAVLDLLDPQPGERILDLGCGDGALTLQLIARGARVVGVDASPEFVAAARARGIDARVGDGEELAFDAAFDAVFSNAALHWMRDHDALLAGVRRALLPGGRFVGEFGAHCNVAAIVVAIGAVLDGRGIDITDRHPWYFPTPEEYLERLETAGFSVDEIGSYPRPTPLPTDMAGWLATFAGPFFATLEDDDRIVALEETVDLLRPALCDRKGRWTADYVRLRFAARRT